MKPLFLSLISLFILSGCQANDSSEETTGNDQPDTSETSEESTEENNNSGNEEEQESATEESNDNVGNQEGTSFDIHSDEVQQALFSSSSVEEGNLTFSQDVITQGMSRAEVEERYGTYDLIYPGGGAAVVIYGNLGVVYSDSRPFIPSNDSGDEETNPDENNVEDVLFYAGLPYNEVVEALGEPDVDVYETEGGPVGGVRRMEYVIEDKENSTVKGVFDLHDNESGEEVVGTMVTIEEPDSADESTAQQPNDADEDGSQEPEGAHMTEEERIEAFISNYIDSLMAYYNNDDTILEYMGEESPAYEKISSNKDSGNYRNHETYNINIIDIINVEYNEYEVTVSREYEHISSNGRSVTEVEYTIIETPQGFMIFDYQELNNESVE